MPPFQGLILLFGAFYNNHTTSWLFLSPKDWNDCRKIKLHRQNRAAVTFYLTRAQGNYEFITGELTNPDGNNQSLLLPVQSRIKNILHPI
jgi:hypothetical protein